jgi:hypothetical protein
VACQGELKLYLWQTQAAGGPTSGCFSVPFEVDGQFDHARDTPIPGVAHEVAVSSPHSCALAQTAVGAAVECWTNAPDPEDATMVPELDEPHLVSAGYDHACAVDEGGLSCWGAMEVDQPELLEDIHELASSADHTCAVSDQGVDCWSISSATINVPDALQMESGANETVARFVGLPRELTITSDQSITMKLHALIGSHPLRFSASASGDPVLSLSIDSETGLVSLEPDPAARGRAVIEVVAETVDGVFGIVDEVVVSVVDAS